MSPKLSNNKGVAWLYSEVCALLDVWADHDIQQQLAGRLHNMCVYDKISKRLLSLGIDRTGEQCREKIKKLKRDYKTVVDNNYAPAFARKLLGCYDKVHEVFGKCAVVKPSSVIESLVIAENKTNSTNEPRDSVSSSLFEIQKFMALASPEMEVTVSMKERNADTSNENTLNNSDLSRDNLFQPKGNHENSQGYHYDSDTESGEISDTNYYHDRSHAAEKQSRKRKYMEAMFESFTKTQEDMRARFLQFEEKRLKQELKLEKFRLQMVEKRRQQERQHELRIFQALLSVLSNKQRESVLILNGKELQDGGKILTEYENTKTDS